MSRIAVVLGALCLLVAPACASTSMNSVAQRQIEAAPRLPVVACPTGETPDLTGRPLRRNAIWVWVRPTNLPPSVPIPSGMPMHVAARLARYEGDVQHARDMNILAPRGWKCTGYIPEDGNWRMTVAPPTARPNKQIHASFYWAGAGFGIACAYFESARADAPNPAQCHTPAHTTVTERTSRLVATITAPAGSWTRFAARGFLYWHPKGPPGAFAEGASCVLPTTEQPLCGAILTEAVRRQGRELAELQTR